MDVWPWYLVGPGIGLVALALPAFRNRLLSASSCFTYLVDRAGAPPPARFDPLSEPDPEPDWLGFFAVGLVLGGAAGGGLSGGPALDWSLPGLEQVYAWPGWARASLMAIGGVLIGFGTRMAGGCTSGHCIVGVSARQKASLLATAAFFATGIAASFAVELWFGRLG